MHSYQRRDYTRRNDSYHRQAPICLADNVPPGPAFWTRTMGRNQLATLPKFFLAAGRRNALASE